MLNQNYTTELLNLEDVIVTKVENTFEPLHIHLYLRKRRYICGCGKRFAEKSPFLPRKSSHSTIFL